MSALRLKRVGVLSVAVTSAAVYVVAGFLVGILFALISMLGSGIAAMANQEGAGAVPPFFGLIFGVGAIVILPVFYGFLGFVGGAIAAAIYNLMAKLTGGIEMTLE